MWKGGMVIFSEPCPLLLSLFKDERWPLFPVHMVGESWVLFPNAEPLFVPMFDSELGLDQE
jgi:hypothetical protein